MKRFALSLMLFFVASLCGLAVYSQCTTPSHGNSFYYLTGVNTAGGSRNIAVSNSGYNSANAGYTDDFLNHEVAINPGNKFNLSLSTNNALTYKRVWVDWNRDGEFNGTDELVSIFGNSTGTTVSDSIEVSASRAGTYRMRIQTRYYASFPQPCGYYASGETEDYALVASVANDAALLALEKDLYCFGSQDIKVRLKNNGNNNLTSVSIAGRLGNTTFNTFNFSGSLAPGSDTLISLGNHSFTAGQADTLRIYSFSPNATSDGNSIDDTLSKIIRPAMSGTYTIGGTNPDYNGFTAAFNALNNNGLCGNVVFEVRSGTYTESFFIDAYDGSENYSITVRQAASNSSDPLVQNSAQVVKFRSALNLVWDGVDIKNTGFSNAVYFQGNNRDITIKNATIEGTSSNSTTVSYATIYDLSGATNQSENIRIESNTIKGGSYGLFVNGGSTSTPDKEWLIKNNTVEDFYYMGIRADYTDSLVLEGNSVQDKGVYSYPYGIYANFSMNIKLRSNDIQFDNKIGPYGIFMSRCDGTGGDTVEVINNFIRIEGSSTSYGLYLSQVDYANVEFNTVRLSTNNQASYALYSNFSLHGRYRNNNLAQFGSGAVVYLNPTTSLYVDRKSVV